MHKQPVASAMGWMLVLGMMLTTVACEPAPVQPAPTKVRPHLNVVASDDDPPEKPIKPGGGQ